MPWLISSKVESGRDYDILGFSGCHTTHTACVSTAPLALTCRNRLVQWLRLMSDAECCKHPHVLRALEYSRTPSNPTCHAKQFRWTPWLTPEFVQSYHIKIISAWYFAGKSALKRFSAIVGETKVKECLRLPKPHPCLAARVLNFRCRYFLRRSISIPLCRNALRIR
jgi:hypothetical protein